ncbi:MAG: exodeoxyribonuclease VII large subunit [Deltaproteobacteria bacterium]|nr:exodeoxyribonuclease VII large subunit [Deltaproteobacteria bacterium]
MSEPSAAAGPPVYSVSQVLAGLKGLLQDRVGRLWVSGEVSNLRVPASGHAYFTLKDDAGQLRAVLFRGAARRLAFDPEDGLEVLAYGELTVYEPRGDLQLIVQQLEPRGRGALQLAFEQLRGRLEGEGLFDAERKQELPAWPRVVGVVTSSGAAALRDVVHVVERRFPAQPLLLASSRVQGAGAEDELAAALEALDAQPDVEVILLVRGGGSLEDLQPFNTERLARAIAACATPVVSGVGHEVDVTIADLAADLRAATPSAAAAAALPDRERVAIRLDRDARRLVTAGRRAIERMRNRADAGAESLRLQAPRERLAARRGQLVAAGRALRREIQALLAARAAGMAASAGRLETLSPLGVVARGYAIVERAVDGAIVRRAGDVAVGDGLRVRLAEGELDARVEAAREASPSGSRRS